MPVYDYQCDRCGPFTEMRPMAECDLPHDCPECGDAAPRAFLSVPYLASMSSERRLAYATNERSASSPQTLSGLKAHGGSCGCCSGKSFRPDKRKSSGKTAAKPAEPSAAKSFPSRRPWMISH
jgi:putative FmdB family regulatory protein